MDAFSRSALVVAIVLAAPFYARLLAAYGPNFVPPEADVSHLPRENRIAAALMLEKWHFEHDQSRKHLLPSMLLFALGVVVTVGVAMYLNVGKHGAALLAILILGPGIVAWTNMMRTRADKAFDTERALMLLEQRIDLPGSGVWLRADERSIKREIQRDIQTDFSLRKRALLLLILLPVFAVATASAFISDFGTAFSPLLAATGVPQDAITPASITLTISSALLIVVCGAASTRLQIAAATKRRIAQRRSFLAAHNLSSEV